MIKGYGSIWIHVTSMEKAQTFYKNILGLEELSFQGGSDGYASYKVPGGPALSMHVKGENEPGRDPGTVSGIQFTVDDPIAVAKEIQKRGGRITDEPKKQPWGATTATIADPDGNEFIITT